MSKEEQAHPAFIYGTDAQFLKWVSYQPSILDGGFNQPLDNEGEARNIACHVRRIKRGSGMGIKPPFSAVPMTNTQHFIQSNKNGEQKCLAHYKFLILSAEEAALWFEKAADGILDAWIEHRKQGRYINCTIDF